MNKVEFCTKAKFLDDLTTLWDLHPMLMPLALREVNGDILKLPQ